MGGKTVFSIEEIEVWKACWSNGKGLSSATTWNMVDMIQRNLGLVPKVMIYGDSQEPFDAEKFKAFRHGDRHHRDGYLGAIYVADDFETKIGVGKSTVYGWAQALGEHLGFPLSRADDLDAANHPFCPYFRPPTAIQEELRQTQRTTMLRGYRDEFVVFFLMAYTKFDEPVRHRVYPFWSRVTENWLKVTALGVKYGRDPHANDEELDIEFTPKQPQAETTPKPKIAEPEVVTTPNPEPSRVPSRLPKAASNLVHYNPKGSKLSEADQIKAQIEQLQAQLKEAEERDLRRELASTTILHDKSSLDRDERIYHTLVVEFANETRAYYTFDGFVEEPASSAATSR